jgi:hypothetical protein
MMATNRPTTTGGRAIPVLMRLRINLRPRNWLNASQVPNGKPIKRLTPVAKSDTCKERTVISKTSVNMSRILPGTRDLKEASY